MERFLISRLSSLGDVVQGLPAACALKRAKPDCHITWVVDARFVALVECCSAVDRAIAWRPSLSPSAWPVFEHEFDVAIDLQGLLKSAIPVARAKARQKVGYHWQREGAWLFSQRVLPDATSNHFTDQCVDVARSIGGEADRAEFGVVPDPDALERAKTALREARGGSEGPFVAVSVSAGWKTKQWPAPNVAGLVDLLTDAGIDVVLVGGKAEDDISADAEVSGLTKTTPPTLVGKTGLKEVTGVLSLAKCHVGGDTGTTHIAAALGVPCVGLYSMTRPERTGPYGQIATCHYDPRGMRYIDPAEVANTVKEIVA